MAGNPRKKYRPDYDKLYPSIDIGDAVINVLKKSDRKMEYQEYDMKNPREKKDQNGNVVAVLPPREDSLDEHLEYHQQFKDTAADTEQTVIDADMAERLLAALNTVDDQERELIHALFYQGMTEREYAKILGIKQPNVFKRKHKILKKLKEFF